MNDQLYSFKKDNETNKIITSQQNNILLKIKDDLTRLYNENSELKSQNVSNLKVFLIFILKFFLIRIIWNAD